MKRGQLQGMTGGELTLLDCQIGQVAVPCRMGPTRPGGTWGRCPTPRRALPSRGDLPGMQRYSPVRTGGREATLPDWPQSCQEEGG